MSAKQGRLKVCADALFEIVGMNEEYIPKKALIETAIGRYKSNGRMAEEPFFNKYSDGFLNVGYFERNWFAIVERVAQDYNVIVDARPFEGTLIGARRKEVEESESMKHSSVQGQVGGGNARASLFNALGAEIPSQQYKLLLPKPKK
jgi:hypothetical protein